MILYNALPEEDITSVHVTCWVTSPYFEAEVVDMELPFPTTLPRLRDALKDSCSVMPEWAGGLYPRHAANWQRLCKLCCCSILDSGNNQSSSAY